MSLQSWRLATCSYHAYKPEMGIAVRTSIGAPKYFAFPHITAKVLFPYATFRNKALEAQPIQASAIAYGQSLSKHRTDVEITLDRLSDLYPKQTLVLLCYENVHKGKGHECHRRWAAQWFLDEYELVVPELSPVPKNLATAVEALPPMDIPLF